MFLERRRTTTIGLVALLSIGVTACDGEGLPSLPSLGTGDNGATTVPATEPPATEPAVTEPPATEPAVTEPPATAPPATEPPPTEPPATEPPATEPPATEPVATEPSVSSAPSSTLATTDAGDGVPAWLLAVAIAGALLVLALVIAAARRGRARDVAAERGRQLLATARWLHDQLSLELLALPPTDAQQRWATERTRFDQLSIDARTLAAERDPEMWNGLASATDSLASSIDTAVRVRAAEGVEAELARESIAIANRRRAELEAWINGAGRFV